MEATEVVEFKNDLPVVVPKYIKEIEAKTYLDEAGKHEDPVTKAEDKARADQLTSCARQLLKTCIKVSSKS